jgi:hypothetical protein
MSQQRNEFMKLLTMFYGYFNSTMNMEVEAWEKARLTGKPQHFIGQTLLLSIIPAALGGLLLEAWPDDDEADKYDGKLNAWAVWYALQLTNYVGGQFVGVREFVNGTTSGFGFSLSPVESLGEGLVSAARSIADIPKWIEEGEIPDAFIKTLARLIGMIKGVPGTGQLVRSTDTAVKMARDEQKHPPRNDLEAAQQLILTGDR